MKKKILLLGCVASVIVLVLASFSSVVGFQKNEYNNALVSPLFNIRTNMALKTEKQEDITNNYIGKGKESTLFFSSIKNNDILIQNFIEKIIKISDDEFNRLIGLVKNKLGNNIINDADNIIKILYNLRGNNKINLDKKDDIIAKTPLTEGYDTCQFGCTHQYWKCTPTEDGITCYLICDHIKIILNILFLIIFGIPLLIYLILTLRDG